MGSLTPPMVIAASVERLSRVGTRERSTRAKPFMRNANQVWQPNELETNHTRRTITLGLLGSPAEMTQTVSRLRSVSVLLGFLIFIQPHTAVSRALRFGASTEIGRGLDSILETNETRMPQPSCVSPFEKFDPRGKFRFDPNALFHFLGSQIFSPTRTAGFR
jgi:hypothetical protein